MNEMTVFREKGWRDIIIRNIYTHHTALCYIIDQYRHKVHDVLSTLKDIREGANIRYSFTRHAFEVKYGIEEHIYTNTSHKYSSWCISKEDDIQKDQMKYYINHIEMLFYKDIHSKKFKLSFQLICLLEVFKSIMLMKLEKSYTSFYKFLYKIKCKRLKSYETKKISKLLKTKQIKIDKIIAFHSKQAELYDTIKTIVAHIKNSNTYTNKIAKQKEQLIALLESYINEIDILDPVTLHLPGATTAKTLQILINKDTFTEKLKLYIPSIKKIESLINILPDSIYKDIVQLCKT